MTDELPTRYKERLLATMAAVEQAAGEGTWEQNTYRCETGMCFAGHAVELAGYAWASDFPNSPDYSFVIADGGERKFASEAAAEWLGIGGDWASVDRLFRASNSLTDLRREVRWLVDPPVEAGPPPAAPQAYLESQQEDVCENLRLWADGQGVPKKSVAVALTFLGEDE
jgi:hypothetical protein